MSCAARTAMALTNSASTATMTASWWATNISAAATAAAMRIWPHATATANENWRRSPPRRRRRATITCAAASATPPTIAKQHAGEHALGRAVAQADDQAAAVAAATMRTSDAPHGENR